SGDELVELHQAVGVWRGAVAQRLLLADRAVDLGVAPHGDVEDAIGVGQELILTEHAEPQLLGIADGPTFGRLLLGPDLEQRRLAAAVGADQTIALPWVELKADVLVQRLGAKVLAEPGQGDHLTSLFRMSPVAAAGEGARRSTGRRLATTWARAWQAPGVRAGAARSLKDRRPSSTRGPPRPGAGSGR